MVSHWCVLLVTFDQWRGDWLSALGHSCARTPHLDALAAEGVLFRRHFASAVPCGPSRASLLTGLYLHNHRSVANGVPLDDRHTNLAREMRAAGYDPRLFGFTDTSLDPRTLPPGDPGLETFASVLPGFSTGLHLTGDHLPWLDWLASRGYPKPDRPRDLWRPSGGLRSRVDAAPTTYTAAESETAFLTRAAKLELERLAALDAPWFLHVSYFRPHSPFIAPAPYNRLFSPQNMPPPKRAASLEAEGRQHPWLAHVLARQSAGTVPVPDELSMSTLDDTGVAQLRATYAGMVAQCDDALGELLATLRSTGSWDNTLVIVTSDHGELLGDHHLWGKDAYFDAAAHVPLVVRDPRTEADRARGTRIGAFTEGVDLMPTILEWALRPVPVACDGESLVPFLLGSDAPPGWRLEAHWELDFRPQPGRPPPLALHPEQCGLAVLRGERFKYVHFTALPPLLFDLGVDQDEFRNVAGHPDYRDAELACARRMLSWRMSYDDRSLSHLRLGPEGVSSAIRGFLSQAACPMAQPDGRP